MAAVWDPRVRRFRDPKTGRFVKAAAHLASLGERERSPAAFPKQAARRSDANRESAIGSADSAPPVLTVRRALASTSSLKELKAAAAAEVARIRGPGGRRVNFVFETLGSDPRIPDAERRCGLKSAQEHVEGILRGLERFPQVDVEFVSVTHSATDEQAKGVYAYVLWGNRVFFNLRYSSTPGRRRYLANLRNDGKAGWHPAHNDSPIAVALHEFAHILDVDALDGSIHFLANRLYKEAIQPGPGKPAAAWELASGGISSYAKTNAHELIAEAFADYMVNGTQAAGLSKAIFELLDGEYQARQRKADR